MRETDIEAIESIYTKGLNRIEKDGICKFHVLLIQMKEKRVSKKRRELC